MMPPDMSAAAALIWRRVDSFLKKLETAGREQYFQQFSDDSDSLLLISIQTLARLTVTVFRFTVWPFEYADHLCHHPTAVSEDSFFRDLFMSDTNYDSLQYQELLCRRGSPRADRFFCCGVTLFGGFMVLLFEKRGYCTPPAFPSASFRSR